MATLYTFGYLSPKAERILSELIAMKTPVVDVRYKPTSKRWQWTQEALQTRLCAQYTWIQELGNEMYLEALNGKFKEPHIKLHAPEIGLTKLKTILDEHGRAAIFCACASKKTCHRIAVAELAKEQFGVTVTHL
jgi:nicotinamidase-related amidase